MTGVHDKEKTIWPTVGQKDGEAWDVGFDLLKFCLALLIG